MAHSSLQKFGMEEPIKHLDVKWMPDTATVVALTIARRCGVERDGPPAEASGAASKTDMHVRRIVIFQGADLRTDVLVAR